MMHLRFIFLILFISNSYAWSKTRISISNFKDKSGVGRCKVTWFGNNELGSGMADQLISELSKSDRFEIQERESLKQIYSEEHQLINSDKSAAPRKNKFKAAHYSIVAAITSFEMCADGMGGSVDVGGFLGFKNSGLKVGGKRTNAKVVIDLRIVDVEQGKVIKSWSSEGKASSTSFDLKGNYKGSGFGSDGFNSTPIGEATRFAISDIVNNINSALPDRANEPSSVAQNQNTTNVQNKIDNQQARSQASVGSLAPPQEAASETSSRTTILCPHTQNSRLDALEMCKAVQKTAAGRYEMLYLSDGSQKILTPDQVKVLTTVSKPSIAQVIYVQSSSLPSLIRAYPAAKSFQSCKILDFTNQSASILCRGKEFTLPIGRIYSVGNYQPRTIAGK